jgi:hypothetical protein
MPQYIIYFNQHWVGDHPEEWFIRRGPLSRAVVAEMHQNLDGAGQGIVTHG